MGWEDIGSLSAPVTWTGVVVFALATLRWLVTRGDDLQREAIAEMRRQRDEALDRARKAEQLVRAYHRRHGPLPEAAVTGSIPVADLMEAIRLRGEKERE